MTMFANSLIKRNVALFLVFTFITTSVLIIGKINVSADVTTPYITTLDSERVSVTTRTSKIYSDTNATVSTLPSGPVISRATNLKSAITTYKDNYITGMSAYEDTYINLNTTIDDKLAIVNNNDTLIAGYRNSTTIPTVTSETELIKKINAATGSLTVKIATLNILGNTTYGSATKPVTLIVNNLYYGNANKTLTVYGNLVVLDSLIFKNTPVTIKKTTGNNDGNFYIDKPANAGSDNTFIVGNMLYTANDYTLNNLTSITADSIICGKSLTNNSYSAIVNATNDIFVRNNFTVTQVGTFTSKNLVVNGDFINNVANSTFNVSNTFYENNNILLNATTNISAGYLIVDGSVINSISTSNISIVNTFYLSGDLKINQVLNVTAKDLLVEGSIINSYLNSKFTITNALYVENDFILNQKATITAYSMFVGVNLANYSLDQIFTIQRDIFVGNATFTTRTSLVSVNGDFIVEATLALGTETIVDIGGRMAVGGNITCSGTIVTITAGGKTTSVLIPNVQEPVATPSPSMTPSPVDTIMGTQIVPIKQALITPDTTSGNFLLTITYKRLAAVIKEQIIIQDSAETIIKTIDIDPTISGTPDIDGYVTYNNMPFYAVADTVSIAVKATTQIISYTGSSGGVSDKPYFTNSVYTRISVPTQTSTIYVDHSAQTVLPTTVKEIDLKSLRKAIADYSKYLFGVKKAQYDSYEKVARVYNGRTIEQIEAIIAADTTTNIVIETDDLSLTKDIVLGSAKKSVTLIVESLTASSPRNVEIFGNLIVKSNFNANQAISIKTNKVYGYGGNFYTNIAYYASTATLNIANMLYATSINMQQGSTINAGTIVVADRLTLNGTSQIAVLNDIYSGAITCNQPTNIVVTSGDLVVRNDLTLNSAFSLNVGGRVAVGKRVTANASITLLSGTRKTALILPGEYTGPGVVVIITDNYSKPIVIDLKTPNSPGNINQIVNFNNNQVYFAGDAIYYKVYLPDNFTNMTLTYSLNQSGQVSIFDILPNTNYYAFDTTKNTALQTSLIANNLAVAPISVSNQAISYIIKTKIKNNITAVNRVNTVNNTLTLNYINADGANVILTKKFTTLVVATSGLRLN